MRFIDLARNRYSVRAYTSQPVEPAALDAVLEAARLAPTADNRQPFQLIVLHTHGREEEIRRLYEPNWFVQAPIVIAICCRPDQAWVRKEDGKHYGDVDAAIVMDHLILAATELGLGTCWVAAFDPEATREVLGLPPGVEPIALTPLGHPADRPGPKRRKPLEELVRYERW